ncbi:MAG: hypothetical protein JXX29_02890 [Deltaproteobacteria bacterium]|nr:hypothetical protein [Deltaproteobacteria bacterium]MBN2670589.1 hypothetical protein [Deltaproteobacteria bacterium]
MRSTVIENVIIGALFWSVAASVVQAQESEPAEATMTNPEAVAPDAAVEDASATAVHNSPAAVVPDSLEPAPETPLPQSVSSAPDASVPSADIPPAPPLPSDDAVAAPSVIPAPWPNRTEPRRHLLLLGGGGALGFIYPKEVNDYMADWINAQGDIAVVEEGFTEMILSLVPNISLSYSPVEYVNLELFTEFGWAPKILAVQGGDSEVFNFLRISPGLNVLFHIPFRSYRNSFFIGGGVEFDMLKFEDFRANALGARGKLGIRMLSRKTVIDLFAAVLVTKRESDEVSGMSLELNYTSVLLGTSIYFYLHGKD